MIIKFKNYILRTKKAFKMKKNALSIIFKGLSFIEANKTFFMGGESPTFFNT